MDNSWKSFGGFHLLVITYRNPFLIDNNHDKIALILSVRFCIDELFPSCSKDNKDSTHVVASNVP